MIIARTIDVDGVISRMKEHKGCQSNKDVALMLNLSPEDFSNRKRRGTLLSLIIDWAFNESVDLNWLVNGDENTHKGYPLTETLKSASITNEPEAGFVQVPRYEVKASAGGGSVIHSEQIVDHLSFRSDWVKNALGVAVKDLALINVTGDSMEPTLSEGDLILIDMSHRGMKDNAVYVLQLNGSLLVKRLQHKLDGSIVVKSDNYAKYEPETVAKEDTSSLNIIGRVVWCGRRM